MQKRVTIITIILVSIIFLGTAIGLYFMANGSYSAKSAQLTKDIASTQAELDALKADKDANNFTPTEVVKAFFEEVKSDSTAKAKLYLAPEAQNMDTKATLKLGTDLANVTTGDNVEQADGDNINVSINFDLPTGETVARTFALSKYDNVWKITGVTAE